MGKALGRVLPFADGKINCNSQNSKDMRLGILTAQPANVQAKRARCSRLLLLEKMRSIFEKRVELVRHAERPRRRGGA